MSPAREALTARSREEPLVRSLCGAIAPPSYGLQNIKLKKKPSAVGNQHQGTRRTALLPPEGATPERDARSARTAISVTEALSFLVKTSKHRSSQTLLD